MFIRGCRGSPLPPKTYQVSAPLSSDPAKRFVMLYIPRVDFCAVCRGLFPGHDTYMDCPSGGVF